MISKTSTNSSHSNIFVFEDQVPMTLRSQATVSLFHKGPVKLKQRVQIAHSFLRSSSNQFHVIILSLSMKFYKLMSKNFSKPTSKNGEIGRFNRSLLTESF